MDEVYEIDESMLRSELRRLRRLREQAEDMAASYGEGEVGMEPFVEVDEDTLINVLADELGRADVAMPTVESRRRQARHNSRRVRSESRSRQSTRQSRRSRAALSEAKTQNAALKKQLEEMNLFNAKLLYMNKLMQNRNVSSKRQRAIVEALDNAKTVREAKLVYEGLNKSLSSKSLSEGKRRVLGSSSKPTRSAASAGTLNEGVDATRWAKLAGIK
jgi:hypothetical protein